MAGGVSSPLHPRDVSSPQRPGLRVAPKDFSTTELWGLSGWMFGWHQPEGHLGRKKVQGVPRGGSCSSADPCDSGGEPQREGAPRTETESGPAGQSQVAARPVQGGHHKDKSALLPGQAAVHLGFRVCSVSSPIRAGDGQWPALAEKHPRPPPGHQGPRPRADGSQPLHSCRFSTPVPAVCPPWAPQRGPVGGQGPRDRGHAEAGGVRTCWYRCAHTCPTPSQGLAKTLASERELPLGPPGLSKENEPPAFPLGTAQRGLGLGRGQKETRPGSGPVSPSQTRSAGASWASGSGPLRGTSRGPRPPVLAVRGREPSRPLRTATPHQLSPGRGTAPPSSLATRGPRLLPRLRDPLERL